MHYSTVPLVRAPLAYATANCEFACIDSPVLHIPLATLPGPTQTIHILHCEFRDRYGVVGHLQDLAVLLTGALVDDVGGVPRDGTAVGVLVISAVLGVNSGKGLFQKSFELLGRRLTVELDGLG